MNTIILFFKSHIDTYTRKDGVTVQAHDDKRQAKGKTFSYSKHHDAGGRVKTTRGMINADDADHAKRLVHEGMSPEERKQSLGVEIHGEAAQPKDWRDEENWHTRTQGKFATYSEAQLRYVIKDAGEAAKHAYAMGNNKKGGQYDDEVHYASMELKKRQGSPGSSDGKVATDKHGRAQPAP